MSAIPPDLVRSSRQEVEHRWPDFVAGLPLFFGDLNIRKSKDGRIVAGCYSSYSRRENLTEAEARERISVAREEVAALAAAFPELKKEFDRGVDFEFCYDYGTAAVVVAEERSGIFKSAIESG